MYNRLTKKVGDKVVCSLHSDTFCDARKCENCSIPAMLMEQLFAFENIYCDEDDAVEGSETQRLAISS